MPRLHYHKPSMTLFRYSSRIARPYASSFCASKSFNEKKFARLFGVEMTARRA